MITRHKCVLELFVVVVCLLVPACKHSTEPPIQPGKDPRTYSWTVQVLTYPESMQTNMRDVWGSSPTDVYVVGHNDRSLAVMWHYDGQTWQVVRLGTLLGGPISEAMQLTSVLGSGANDVWAVGARIYSNWNPPPNFFDSSRILHFDGTRWREWNASGGSLLEVIRASSKTDIWAGGWFNTLFHFDGALWKRDSLPVVIPPETYFNINVLLPKSADDVYASGYLKWTYLAKSVYYLFRRQQGKWSVIDSGRVQPGLIEYKWGVGDMWMSPSGAVYSCGAGIFRENGNTWEWMYDPNFYLYKITGTSDQNIFVVGDYNTVLHYNGKDWHRYPEINSEPTVFQGVWTNGREVFVVGATIGSYPEKTVVLHGK